MYHASSDFMRGKYMLPVRSQLRAVCQSSLPEQFAPKAVKPEKRQLTLPTLTLDFSWRKYMDAVDHVKPIDGNAFLPDS